MTTTVQSLISANAGPAASDLQPLLANDAFCSAANAELKVLDNTAAANAALNAKSEDLVSGIHAFAGAVNSLRGVAKRFPETSTYIAEAVKQVQLAMGVVKGNVPKVVTTPPTPIPTPNTTPTTVPPTPTVTPHS